MWCTDRVARFDPAPDPNGVVVGFWRQGVVLQCPAPAAGEVGSSLR